MIGSGNHVEYKVRNNVCTNYVFVTSLIISKNFTHTVYFDRCTFFFIFLDYLPVRLLPSLFFSSCYCLVFIFTVCLSALYSSSYTLKKEK